MLLRDKFWLWGHPEGRYNSEWGNDKASRMTPMEGCIYLGVRNTFMVPVEWEVNHRQYNKSFKTLHNVGWGYCFHSKKYWGFENVIDKIIDNAREFPNNTCVAFDDFKFRQRYQTQLHDELRQTIGYLHNNEVRYMNCWMTLYTHEFGEDEKADKDFQQYIDLMDGIVMWNWYESRYKSIPEKFEIFKKLTENKRRMCGCYLYNFGENKQATGEAVKWQLDWYREKLLAGEIEGVVLHTNTMADLDYESYDIACKWMEEHGDEEIGE